MGVAVIILRMRSSKNKMASLMLRRSFSVSRSLGNLKPTLATPAPVEGTAALTTPELKALAAKATGHWSELSKDEKVMCKWYPLLWVWLYMVYIISV